MRCLSFNSQLCQIVDLQEIRRIVELMNEHGLTHFDLTKKDLRLKLKKGADLDDLRGLLAALPVGQSQAQAAAVPAAASAISAPAPIADGMEITSPMVGTFTSSLRRMRRTLSRLVRPSQSARRSASLRR